MPSWNELHYERAAEFSRLIAALYSRGVSLAVVPAPAVGRPATTLAAPPPPAGPAAAALSPPAAAPKTAPTPTAASIFNKIPWKK